MKIQLLEVWTVLISNLKCMSLNAKGACKWQRKAYMIPCSMSEQNQLRGLGAIKSLAQAMPMKPKALKMVMSLLKFLGRYMRCFFFGLLTEKKAYSPQKGCFSQRFWALKKWIFGFNSCSCSLFQIKCCHLNLSHSGDFRCKSKAFWSTSSSDSTNRITCNGWLFLPGQPGPQISWTNH